MLLALSGCGGGGAAAGGAGASARPGAVELSLRDTDGEWRELSSYRGAPLLVFVFATYDGASQASLRPLSRLMHDYPELQVIGIAAQFDAEMLVDAWVYALAPPFAVVYDAGEEIAQGRSGLGPIDAVPTYITLDATGHFVERLTGYQDGGALLAMMRRAEAASHRAARRMR